MAVTGKTGNFEITLLDAGGQTRARAATLDIDDDNRHFSHHGPAKRFGLQRKTGTGSSGQRKVARVGSAAGHGDGREFILGLHKNTAVFRQFRAQDFHDARPRRNRVARAEANASRDRAVRDGLVAIHDDLLGVTRLLGGMNRASATC
jgi:hypothetical protein